MLILFSAFLRFYIALCKGAGGLGQVYSKRLCSAFKSVECCPLLAHLRVRKIVDDYYPPRMDS